MKATIVALAALLPLSVSADLVLDVRGNDPGYMEMVEPEDVQVLKTLDFTGPSQYFNEKDGFQVHAVLEGMTTACIESDRNPCQFDKTPGCTSNIGRVFDDPKPNLPFTATSTEFGGGILHYNTFRSPTGRASFSRGGCGDWGDGPWAVVFPEPYTAVCVDVRLSTSLRRQHFNFWRDNDGIAEMVGHHDLVGELEDPIPRDSQEVRTFCWASTKDIGAFTTWQNGSGIWWIRVHVGEPATTECERATRKADEAAENAGQVCQ